jgi:hypothetical protein
LLTVTTVRIQLPAESRTRCCTMPATWSFARLITCAVAVLAKKLRWGTIMIYEGRPDGNGAPKATPNRPVPAARRLSDTVFRAFPYPLLTHSCSRFSPFYCCPACQDGRRAQFTAASPARRCSLPPAAPLVLHAPSDTTPAPPTGDEDDDGSFDEVGRFFFRSEPPPPPPPPPPLDLSSPPPPTPLDLSPPPLSLDLRDAAVARVRRALLQ